MQATVFGHVSEDAISIRVSGTAQRINKIRGPVNILSQVRSECKNAPTLDVCDGLTPVPLNSRVLRLVAMVEFTGRILLFPRPVAVLEEVAG